MQNTILPICRRQVMQKQSSLSTSLFYLKAPNWTQYQKRKRIAPLDLLAALLLIEPRMQLGIYGHKVTLTGLNIQLFAHLDPQVLFCQTTRGVKQWIFFFSRTTSKESMRNCRAQTGKKWEESLELSRTFKEIWLCH